MRSLDYRLAIAAVAVAGAVAGVAGCGSGELCGAATPCGNAGWRSCTSSDRARCWYVTTTGKQLNCDSCTNCTRAALGIADFCRAQGGGSDGGGVDMTSGDLGGFVVQSGTYAVSNATTVRDGCKISPVPAMMPVFSDGIMLSIGQHYDPSSAPQAFSPAGYTLGSGRYTSATMAMLLLATTVTLSDGCMFSRDDTTQVTILGSNMMSVDWTHRRSGYSSSCVTSDEAPTDPCVSEFKFNLGM